MKRGLLVIVAVLALPAPALAGPCGLPDSKPLWIDFGVPELESVFAQPGTVLTGSSGDFPARVRARGAKTIYWDMRLNARVGTPAAPADPAVIDERAERLFVFAASQTACPTPWIVLNELFGANLETPWTPNNQQYRDNVLALMRGLARRGALPFLLLAKPPYTGNDAADWWRAVAEVGVIVPEVYPNARLLHAQGAVLANRRLRAAYRRPVARLVAIGVPIERIALIPGFHSAPGTGGREGLRPREAWLEMVKWHALSARHVAVEMGIPTIFSWGWGTYSVAGRDPDKPAAACVWLWTRNPRLCNGPQVAGPKFSRSRREGQLVLPSGAMCKFGRHTISLAAIAKLNRLVGDRDVAYTALLARLAEARRVTVSAREILDAEAAVIASRFGGSRSGYRAALARAGADVSVARAILADELRRQKAGHELRVGTPAATAVSDFYFSHPDLLVRRVELESPVWWLGGRSSGLALSSVAPDRVFSVPAGRDATVRTLTGRFEVRPVDQPRLLGSVTLPEARPAILVALRQFARSDAVVRWSADRQQELLREAICRRDDLPVPASIDLHAYLPFVVLDK